MSNPYNGTQMRLPMNNHYVTHVVCLEMFKYNREMKKLTLPASVIGMPREFFVKSHVTQKEVRFTAIHPSDVLYDQDQWDGVQQIYRPTTDLNTVDHMVIYEN